ncbi:MAG: SDR family NAD(P)-dependent oxidoreductase [Candidatus Micrarchaeia archaeon]
MKILVTGGAGFIGSHIVDALVEEGHEVRILDSLEKQVHFGRKPAYINENAEFMLGDLRKSADIRRALEGIEAIFHEASLVSVAQSMYDVAEYCNSNITATASLMEFLIAKEHEVKKLVLAASMSCYGEGAYECEKCGPQYPEARTEKQIRERKWEHFCKCGRMLKPMPTNEEKPQKPSSIYALTKKVQEEMALMLGRAYGLPVVALRYFNVYGPRQSLSNPYTGVAAIFSSRIKNDKPPIIYEDGMQTRDFICVDDVVRANMLALKSKNADYRSFNVGSGNPTSILTVACVLTKLYGKKIEPLVTNQYRKGDIRHAYADISRIRALGFEPRVSFEEGMKKLVSWAEKERAEDKLDDVMEELREKGVIE